MQSVKDVIESHEGKAVLFHRHGTYLMNPQGDNPEDPDLLTAMNYAREYPDHNNPLDQNGRDISVNQGQLLAKLGIKINKILVSRQGRGPETGLYIAIGLLNSSDKMPPIEHSLGADYPLYSSAEDVLKAMGEFGDDYPSHWLNGQLQKLCQESAENFAGRIINAVNKAFSENNITLIASHYENVLYARSRWVAKKDLGSVPLDWQPTKSAGILLVKKRNEIMGFEYDQNFKIIE